MLSYCLMYRKNTDSKNLKVVKIKNSNNNAIIKMSDVSLGLFRDEEIGRLLSNLGIKTGLDKSPVSILYKNPGSILF